MKKEDIDKTIKALEDGLIIFEDIKKAKKSDDKITMLEGGGLARKHARKSISFVASISEIVDEIIDLDGAETSELAEKLITHFGGSQEIIEAINDIAEGAGKLNQGIQKLVSIKNKKD